MVEIVAQGAGEVAGIAAVAGVAMAGAYKLSTMVVKKMTNGKVNGEVAAVNPLCNLHGERLSVMETSMGHLTREIEGVRKDVREVRDILMKK